MLKRIAITSLAAAAVFSTATVALAPVTPAAAGERHSAPRHRRPSTRRCRRPRAGYSGRRSHRLLNDRRGNPAIGKLPAQATAISPIPERVVVGGREQWHYVPSRWDRNGDGIPDRYERQSERGPYGDRDHDGIPNAYDRYDNRR